MIFLGTQGKISEKGTELEENLEKVVVLVASWDLYYFINEHNLHLSRMPEKEIDRNEGSCMKSLFKRQKGSEC
ncbi:hypothetical protein RUM44_009439 [Polyplax serrata]|uniref:Uncharacterized protein n=1 Tax=Polyplax serrata TaxID=468196 RepID=A0ABR1ASP3_POLSC